MKLTGKQLKRIQLAIMDGYSQESLRRMVRIHLDEKLENVAGGGTFKDVAWNLIEWAETQNRLQELIDGAYTENPNNAEVKALHAEAQGWFAPPPKPEAPKPEPAKVEIAHTPAKPHHAFLSYAHQDAEVMRALRRQLDAAGIVTWLDEDSLEPGTPEWQTAIEEGIKQAKCLIVLLSPDAKKSKWVNIEITVASRQHKRIFPVLVRGDDADAVPIALVNTQYVDVRQDFFANIGNKLVPSVCKHMGRMPKVPIDIDWVTIPAGEFIMGSDKSIDENLQDHNMPQHKLYLLEYRISRYPVTNDQYQMFVAVTNHAMPEHWENGNVPNGKGDHPVVNVSWHDAIAFCDWANVQLPSEAEWEKAARGSDGRTYPWGDDQPTDDLCNFGFSVGDTSPVRRYPKGASPYGVMEMAGNVMEWTRSLWGKDLWEPDYGYPYRAEDGREKLDSPDTVMRVVRGGSWCDDFPQDSAASRRNRGDPRETGSNLGFRLVLSPSPYSSEL